MINYGKIVKESVIKQEISNNLKSKSGRQLISSISKIESGISSKPISDSTSDLI